MAFNKRDYNVEEWLRLDNDSVLEKVCSIYDGSGRVVEEIRTRVTIVPLGNPLADGSPSKSAPSLRRQYIYDTNGGVTSTVPIIVEWTQICEDISTGLTPPVLPPVSIPVGLAVVKTTYIQDEALAVPYDTETPVITFVVPATDKVYLRHVLGSGDNRGTYVVYVDGVAQQKKRTWWGDFNADFRFDSADGGIFVNGGQTISLKVVNDSRDAATFDGSIGYVLI